MYNEYVGDDIYDSEFDSSSFKFVKYINNKIILFILVSFVLSIQTFIGIGNLFPYIMLGLASFFSVPLILVFIPSIIGIILGGANTLDVANIVIFFIFFSVFVSVINIKGISKKYSVLIRLFISFSVIRIFNILLVNDITLINLFYDILLIGIIYIVFLYGISVILKSNKSYVFTSEENIAALVVITVCLTFLGGVNIFDLSILNIIVTAIILIYGYKSNALLGATAGIITGLTICIINDSSIVYASILAAGGFVSGILNRYGKIPIILGYLISMVVISYSQNISSEILVRVIEVIIASFPLIFMPKKLDNSLDRYFNFNNKFKNYKSNLLGYDKSIEKRIDAVSNIFDNLSDINLEESVEDKEETKQIIKKYLINHINTNCIICENKYKCLDGKLLNRNVSKLCENLENNIDITEEMLELYCNDKKELITHIKEIYRSLKITRIIKRQEKNTNKEVAKQYKEISNILKGLNKDIKSISKDNSLILENIRRELKYLGYTVYEDELEYSNNYAEYIFITDILNDINKDKENILSAATNVLKQNMKVKVIINTSKNEKSKIKLVSASKYEIDTNYTSSIKSSEEESGDYNLFIDLKDYKYMSILSDGMGSGNIALRNSKKLVSYVENLVKGGFDNNNIFNILNSIVKIRQHENIVATLDLLVIDKQKLEMESIKLGAAPTYIIDKGKVSVISNVNLPTGIISELNYTPIVKKLNSSSIIIQISDGVVTDKMNNKDNYFIEYLKKLSLDNDTFNKSSKELVKLLKRKIYDYYTDEYSDDITLIVHKIK